MWLDSFKIAQIEELNVELLQLLKLRDYRPIPYYHSNIIQILFLLNSRLIIL